MPPLRILAKTIRSKNAGVDLITFDIIFPDLDTYRMVCDSNVLTRQSVAKLYNVDPDQVTEFVEFDPAHAIKFTLRRDSPSGSLGDPDIFGSQQYAPLLEVEIPDLPVHDGIRPQNQST